MILLRIKSLSIKIISVLNNLISKKHKVYYVVETANWSIKEDGNNLQKSINIENYMQITFSGKGINNSIVHYGTEGVFFNKDEIRVPHKSNKIIVTWFHILDNDRKLSNLLNADKLVDLWHTSCILTKEKLIKYNIDEAKIRVIPLGINLDIYKPLENTEITKKRDILNIPRNAIVIGSFQKDGIGWGDGLSPKLEKGPDILCDVLQRLSNNYEIFVLLTGPARGYVKNRLRQLNIPFYHEFLNKPEDVVNYFQLCDLYIVASREEGGPKAILESMACGVPLVSTKVGMAPDILIDGVNGYLCDIGDINSIVKKCELIINNPEIKTNIKQEALYTIRNYEQTKVSKEYIKMYNELI